MNITESRATYLARLVNDTLPFFNEVPKDMVGIAMEMVITMLANKHDMMKADVINEGIRVMYGMPPDVPVSHEAHFKKDESKCYIY